jgi:hypothetical protein
MLQPFAFLGRGLSLGAAAARVRRTRAETAKRNTPLAKRRIATHRSDTAKTRKDAVREKKAGSAKVLGVTKDGVRILKPKGRATHFTQKELLDAVRAAKGAS